MEKNYISVWGFLREAQNRGVLDVRSPQCRVRKKWRFWPEWWIIFLKKSAILMAVLRILKMRWMRIFERSSKPQSFWCEHPWTSTFEKMAILACVFGLLHWSKWWIKIASSFEEFAHVWDENFERSSKATSLGIPFVSPGYPWKKKSAGVRFGMRLHSRN